MVVEERALAPIIYPEFRSLDVYAGGYADEDYRLQAIATISAGDAIEKTGSDGKKHRTPNVSRQGVIMLHDKGGRATGLAEALKETGGKSLTIAFPFDDPNVFIQQHFVQYDSSRLLAFGDHESITTIAKDGKRDTFATGSKQYEQLVAASKVATSVYFILARIDDGETSFSFPDGLGMYRLRFTSRNSIRSLKAALRDVQRFTGGHIAGVPFELSLDYPEVAGPDGSRRSVPVWSFAAFKGVTLNSRTFRPILLSAIHEGAALLLTAPAAETIDQFEEDVTEGEFDILQRGGLCDATYWNDRWHAVAAGTPYAADDARHEFIGKFTAARGCGLTSSLSAYLKVSTEADAMALISALELATQNAPDVVTGEVEMTDDERHAAAIKAELFAGNEPAAAPETTTPLDPAFDPSVVKPWFTNAVEAKGETPLIPEGQARGLGDAFSSIAGGPNQGITLARYLTGRPSISWRSVTEEEARLFRALLRHEKAVERLAAVLPLAVAWLNTQSPARKKAS